MICTKAGTAPQAVSNLFRHYYGQGLAREIELSPPKKQTVLIHKEIRSFGGIQNFPSLEATHAAAAHQFYVHGGQRANCYALGVQVENIDNSDGSCKRADRAISNEEEHVAPASKYQALATLKNDKFPMLQFLNILFPGATINVSVINNLILQEQALLLLPSAKIYNQPKASRDLITFSFVDGKLTAAVNHDVLDIIAHCISEIIRKGKF